MPGRTWANCARCNVQFTRGATARRTLCALCYRYQHTYHRPRPDRAILLGERRRRGGNSPCTNCGMPVGEGKTILLCGACTSYRWRTGRDRPARLFDSRPQPCVHCQRTVRIHSFGRCDACYVYRWRHGHDRPARLLYRLPPKPSGPLRTRRAS